MHENVDTRSMSKWIAKTLIRFSPRAKNNEVFFQMCWWHSFSLYAVAVINTLMKKIGRRKVYLVDTSSSEFLIEGCQDRIWNRKPIRTLLSNLHTVTPAQKTFLSCSACLGVATPTKAIKIQIILHKQGHNLIWSGWFLNCEPFRQLLVLSSWQ